MKTADKMRKLANTVEMASLNVELMKCESCGRKGEGELASENCMDKGMCITGLLDQQKCRPK